MNVKEKQIISFFFLFTINIYKLKNSFCFGIMAFAWNLETRFVKIVKSLTSNIRRYDHVFASEIVFVSTTISHKICVFALMCINYKQCFL